MSRIRSAPPRGPSSWRLLRCCFSWGLYTSRCGYGSSVVRCDGRPQSAQFVPAGCASGGLLAEVGEATAAARRRGEGLHGCPRTLVGRLVPPSAAANAVRRGGLRDESSACGPVRAPPVRDREEAPRGQVLWASGLRRNVAAASAMRAPRAWGIAAFVPDEEGHRFDEAVHRAVQVPWIVARRPGQVQAYPVGGHPGLHFLSPFVTSASRMLVGPDGGRLRIANCRLTHPGWRGCQVPR